MEPGGTGCTRPPRPCSEPASPRTCAEPHFPAITHSVKDKRAQSAGTMENQAAEPSTYEDVRRSGYLRKQKSMHRRYFVLRAASERGPARLEYYESEKKFRGKAPVPKKVLVLETCFNINKRADSKNKHMIVLYTRAESFAVAAESEADQDGWYQAMVDLQCKIRGISEECEDYEFAVEGCNVP